MAGSPKTALSLLLVSSSVILAMITPSFSCPTRCETQWKWTLYLRQIGKGTERNQVEMVNSSQPIGFGTIVVNNWAVLDAPLPSATVVAHARGIRPCAGWPGQGCLVPFSQHSLWGCQLYILASISNGKYVFPPVHNKSRESTKFPTLIMYRMNDSQLLKLLWNNYM